GGPRRLPPQLGRGIAGLNASNDHSRHTEPAYFDVTAIGNAIVDVIAQASDELVAAEGLAKGAMALIDGDAASHLYAAMGPARESSGGSGANTVAGIAGLGGHAAFIGKVAADELGEVFRHDIRAAGVSFETPSLASGPQTARCLIFVTPD